MKAFLSLGSNVGDRFENLLVAQKLVVQEVGLLIAASSIYETAPWGIKDQPSFLNQVIAVEVRLQPKVLLEKLKRIEKAVGRKRVRRWGPRIIDIDILLMDDLHYESDMLTIPHLQLHKRRFTLVPLAEIAPQLQHPVLKLSVSELLESCDDQSEVRRVQLKLDSQNS